ncbi:MAG TPA: AraC family transcriptional regulator [Pyrinomonadaceae bacterium]|nr:AraC family transcriptional regulator [Pyrinomonadaceae bacterium]
MKYLKTGQFFGETDKTFLLEGITLTDTAYTVEKVDWHYHENPYFTFIIAGGIIEGNKKNTYNCPAGTLLFHNWQEPHYNSNPEKFTRGFQLEIKKDWCDSFDIDLDNLSAELNISNPQVKILFHNIYKETKIFDKVSSFAIEGLLLQAIQELGETPISSKSKKPDWVKKADEFLRENSSEDLTLKILSKELNLHPVYLSRSFAKFFRYNFGEYVRKIKVEKSLILLRNKKLSLTEISFASGFADQSHFNRCFREFIGTSPKDYRKLILQ